jgi:hypothetical protein
VPKVISQKATAFFRATPGSVSIDKEAGVIKGIKVMELGVEACFKGADGKPWRTKITPQHIDALLGFAGNRTMPAHFTHEWHAAEANKQADADSVELAARCGAWKNFRKDEQGNAVADAYLRNDEHREEILFAAEHDPENLMASAVFSYDPQDKTAMPTSFRCVDFVPVGAAVTALFSEADSTQKQPMDINELIEALKDEKVQAAVSAIIKSHKADAPKPEEAKAEDDATAEMEKDADVKPEDKKPEDEQKPALMRRFAPIIRAIARRTNALAVNEAALLSKVELKVKTEATALLGNYQFHGQATGSDGKPLDPEAFITQAITDGKAKHRAGAIALMGKTRSDLYAVHISR